MKLSIWKHKYKGDFEKLDAEFTIANEEISLGELMNNVPKGIVGVCNIEPSKNRLANDYIKTNSILLMPSIIPLTGKLLFAPATDIDNYLLLYKKSINISLYRQQGTKTKWTLKGVQHIKYDQPYYLSVNEKEFNEIQTKLVDNTTPFIPVYQSDIEKIESLVKKYAEFDK